MMDKRTRQRRRAHAYRKRKGQAIHAAQRYIGQTWRMWRRSMLVGGVSAMIELAMAVAIVCTEPRLEFRQFYDKATGLPWPHYPMEAIDSAVGRMLETGAAYLDYAARYRDRCQPAVPYVGMCSDNGVQRVCRPGEVGK